MLEKQLISLFNPLTDILHGLRADQLPKRVTFPPLSDVFLKLGTVQVLAPHSVVPFVQGNGVVPNYSSRIDLPLKASVPLVLIKLKLQSFHAIIIRHISVQNYDEKTAGTQGRRLGIRDP